MMSPVFALLVVLVFLTLSTWYLGRRLIAPLALGKKALLVTRFFLAILVTSGFTAPIAMNLARQRWVEPASLATYQHVSYLILGFLSFLFIVVVIEDILIIFRKAALWFALRLNRRATAEFLTSRVGWFRHHAHGARLGRLGVTCMALGLTAFAAWNATDPQVTTVHIPIKHLPVEFAGYRIALLSDLHIGSSYRADFVARVVGVTNALDVDVVALVGDVADGMPEDLQKDYEPLRRLMARDAKFYVTGNHEYYWDALGWMEAMRGVGFRVLHNEHESIRRGMALLNFGGVPDPQGERFSPHHRIDLDRTFANVDARGNSANILLAHQPKVADMPHDHPIALQLSGHTHGGQFFPWTLLVSAVQKYARGLHAVDNGWVYVGLGVGGWGPPLRLGAGPEIVLVVLEPAG